MTRRQLIASCLLLAVAACAVPDEALEVDEITQAETIAPRVRYFIGRDRLTWPPVPILIVPQNTDVLLKYTWDEENGAIDVLIHQKIVGPQLPTYIYADRTYLDHMTQIGDTPAFHLDAPDFQGTITHSGPDWAWNQWSYDLVAKNLPFWVGGTGTMTEDGMVIHHVIKDSATRLITIFTDTLTMTAIGEEEYLTTAAAWGVTNP